MTSRTAALIMSRERLRFDAASGSGMLPGAIVTEERLAFPPPALSSALRAAA